MFSDCISNNLLIAALAFQNAFSLRGEFRAVVRREVAEGKTTDTIKKFLKSVDGIADQTIEKAGYFADNTRVTSVKSEKSLIKIAFQYQKSIS